MDKKCDVVLPLACITGTPTCDRNPISAKTVNFDAIKLICDITSKQQVTIFPTMNSGYGTTDESLFCIEETPLNPIPLYGRLKVEAEKVVLERG